MRSGVVPADEVEAMLGTRGPDGLRLVDALMARVERDDEEEAMIVAARHRLPFTDLRGADPDATTLLLLRGDQAREYRSLPLRIGADGPLVAVADPNARLREELTAALGAEPRLVVAPAAQLEAAIDRCYPSGGRASRPGHVARPAADVPAPWTHEPAVVSTPDEPDPPAMADRRRAGDDDRMDGTEVFAPQGGRKNLRARAAKGVLWTAAGNWGHQIATFVVFVVLSRLLEPAAFGLVALAAVFVGLTQVIANQGLVDALVQRQRVEREHLDTAFWIGLGFGVACMGIMMALALPLAALLNQDDLALVLVALSATIPIGSTSLVPRALLTRDLAFRSITLRTLAATAVGAGAGIGCAVLGFGVWSLVAQSLAAASAGAVVLWAVTPWKPRFRFSRRHFRDLFGFGMNVVAFRVILFASRRVDDLLIGSFLGAVTLGFYAVAYRMLTMIIEVTSNLIDSVAFPLYSKLQDDRERLTTLYYKTTSFVAVLAFPAFFLLLVLSPQVVEVFFGSKWARSAPVMQILTLIGVVQALNYLNSTMIKALGKPSWRVVLVSINAVLNVVAFAFAVTHGINAVAIALVSVGYLVLPLSYWAVHRLIPIHPATYVRHVWGPLVASLALAAAAFAVRRVLEDGSPLVTLVAGASSGLVAYSVVLLVIARPLSREIRDLSRHALARGGGRRAGVGSASTQL